jgi:DNA-binding NarL/FixJ family response regulator
MIVTVAAAALVTLLATVALGVSVYALFHAHRLFHEAQTAAEAVRADYVAAIEAAQSQINAVATEVQSVKSQAPAGVLPGTAKPGMNLTRRSNALRLHREGTPAEEIAAALEVPRQEVDLLIKVHEIVLNNL